LLVAICYPSFERRKRSAVRYMWRVNYCYFNQLGYGIGTWSCNRNAQQ